MRAILQRVECDQHHVYALNTVLIISPSGPVTGPGSRLATSATVRAPVEHVDVLIVGAGLSGIGAACHLRRAARARRFAILEARDAIGGTWDLFRYPGHPLGLRHVHPRLLASARGRRPRRSPTARRSCSYIRDTARDNDVERHIRFHHRVVRADWSSADARWTVEAERTDTGETVRFTCDFLFVCTGYYRYDEGYTPRVRGASSASRARSSTRSTGPRTSTTPASAWS